MKESGGLIETYESTSGVVFTRTSLRAIGSIIGHNRICSYVITVLHTGEAPFGT